MIEEMINHQIIELGKDRGIFSAIAPARRHCGSPM
jgi:hypothetical protein